MEQPVEQSAEQPDWQDAIPHEHLKAAGSKVVKIGSKQIAVFMRNDDIFACNNRCPHEGYPLKEGTLGDACTLTCNWHNWKFDLRTGDNIHGEVVQIDVADAPAGARITTALDNLHDSFDNHEYDRMAREIARMEKSGGDVLDAVRETIRWTHDRFEFGMGSTHAPMAAADWLTLRETRATDPATKIMPVHEIIGHFAWDSQRAPVYPFPANSTPWDENAFVDAVEREDETAAIALVRGGIADGLSWTHMERGFARAALAHYLDFGHGAIYVQKTGQLLDHLGNGVLEPLLLMLVRGLVYAWREDLIPEFRTYASVLDGWGKTKTPSPSTSLSPDDFEGLGPKKAMALAVRMGGKPEDIYDILFEMNARSLLRFDLNVQNATDRSIAHNHTWLSVTHEITFASAGRSLAQKYPELWPAVLLQMCCFFGRNVGAQDTDIKAAQWAVHDRDAFVNETLASMFDHGRFEYIVTAHLIKTATAVRDEIAARPDAPWQATLLAGLNRFLHSPLKRRHPLRTAKQALSFVAMED